MTTYTEHQLRAEAARLRETVARMQSDLHGLVGLADLLDGAADGRVGESELQAAVDRCTTGATIETAWDSYDAALEADQPDVWREALQSILTLSDEAALRVLMDALHVGLVIRVGDALQDFADAPLASEARN